MPRQRLWTLVALACLAIVVLGDPRLRPVLTGPLLELLASPLLGLTWGMWLSALGVTIAAAHRYAAWYADYDHATSRVRRLAKRGQATAAIARRTGLAQDAVRDLLGAEAPAPAPAAATPRPVGKAASVDDLRFRRALERHAVAHAR
ncbi:MAG: hypothetical protein NW201_00295 [Gemmatimonadales bacterium]|nr:hypothetical protein [Gemmatimonadales bacterium]